MQEMDISYKKSSMAFGIVVVVLFVIVICSKNHPFQSQHLRSKKHALSNDQFMTASTNRRLLASPTDYDVGVGNGGGEEGDAGDYDGNGNGYDYAGGGGGGDGDDDRIRPQCSSDNIYVSQGQTPPLPSGIPTYTVIVQNICTSGGCSISDIHLSCGWFSSARLINPNLFKRIAYNDCLVNNGNAIVPGQTISFIYANTYPYPLAGLEWNFIEWIWSGYSHTRSGPGYARAFGIVAVLVVFVMCSRNHYFQGQRQYISSKEHAFSNRKLLASPTGNDGADDYHDMVSQCSTKNINILQGQTTPLPSGIPIFTVQIQNTCISGNCRISNIHLHCGWFSSARLVNPNLFKRIAFNDCLVNNGKPLNPGQTISFQYANTKSYPMSVSSMECL
ncbi:hypothetical protein LXL04_026990 [Taraxacum kok-saghyz]